MIALLLLSLAGDVAVVVDRADADRVELQVRCAKVARCASAARVDAARADANSLGLRCGLDDAACWRRFCAAEDFSAVVVVAANVAVFVDADRFDSHPLVPGADPGDAVDALLAPPKKTPEPTLPEPVQPPPPTPIPSTTTPPATASNAGLFWSIAGGAALVAAGAGVTASLLSLQLAVDLQKAADQDAPLVDYDARDAAVTGLVVVSGAAVVTGAVAVGLALSE